MMFATPRSDRDHRDAAAAAAADDDDADDEHHRTKICAQGDPRPGGTQRSVNRNTHAASARIQKRAAAAASSDRQRDRASAWNGTERKGTKRNGWYAPCREPEPQPEPGQRRRSKPIKCEIV